jgi:PEP-CTERM motif
MNLTSTQFSCNRSAHSARRLGRVFAATLGLFLLTAVPALAEPVRINQVVQTISRSQGIPDLKLNTLVSQDPAGPKGATSQSGPRNEQPSPNQDGAKTESVLSGVVVISDGPKLALEIIEEGEVEGSICDCGDILMAGGAFPKWPFLFLAAVPLVFINECDDCDENPSSTPTPTPPSNPTPTPTPTPTPEPASLLLFGTGLLAAGAGLRRRYAKSKLVEPTQAQQEE